MMLLEKPIDPYAVLCLLDEVGLPSRHGVRVVAENHKVLNQFTSGQ